MGAASTDLTTLDNLKGYMVNSGQTNDVLLQRMITAISLEMETRMNRDIVSTSYSKSFDGTGGKVLVMPDYPVTAVSSVTIDGQIVPLGSVITPGYYFTPSEIVLNGYRFCAGKQNVVIVYTAGYSTVPADLEQACIGLIQFRLAERGRVGEASRSMGGQTTSFIQKEMPDWIMGVMNNYKKVITA
jgi:hypothetical protein